MNRKISMKDVEPNMQFKVTDPTELNFYGMHKYNKYNLIQNRVLKEGDILTVIKTIDNNQVKFQMDNGDIFIAFWSVFKNETAPMFDTSKVLNKNTVAYYLKENNLSQLTFEIVKKEYTAHPAHRDYPVIMGVRYEYGMKSTFNLDVIQAYKADENMKIFEEIILNKLTKNWDEIQPLTVNAKNNTKIKLLTRRKKVIMEIAELPDNLENAITQIKELIENYKNDSKTHMSIK